MRFPRATRHCKDANRREDSEHTSFDFLGYTFRGRLARGRKGFFVSFLPAMSAQARKAKGQQIRSWHLNRRTGTDLSGIAKDINPQVRGWINYYGVFYHSELFSLMRRIDEHLVRISWANSANPTAPGSRTTATGSGQPTITSSPSETISQQSETNCSAG